jgi:hypothetical protein
MKLKELFENMGLRLKDVCEVSTNMVDADFWLQRKGSLETVGTVLKDYSPENIGVKVIRTDIMDAKFLYYKMMHIHNTKYWQQLAKGSLKLQNIRTEDVKDLRIM